jgi:S-adenosylmethionine hydrolase
MGRGQGNTFLSRLSTIEKESAMNVITFLSDFGQSDGYVGSVKGIILSVNPRAQLVDISHSITPFRIMEAAYILAGYYNDFPRQTVHLAVIDPGVGGTRKPLIIKTSRYFFVGPDNGLFTHILHRESCQVYEINLQRINRLDLPGRLSSTFHARDIFGPVAALLSRGTPAANLGDFLSQPPVVLQSNIQSGQKSTRAAIVMVDHFGNIITGFSQSLLGVTREQKIRSIKIKDTRLSTIHQTYGDVAPGILLALWNSSGFLEIAVNQGSAAGLLQVSPGQDDVEINIE